MTTFDQRGQQVGIQYNIVITPSGQRIPLFKPPDVPHFTNRVTELKKLLDDLRSGKVVTICGPGGIGKTALTAKLIWTLAPENEAPEDYPDGIIFHSFYNQSSVDVALESIAHALGDEAKPTPFAGAQRALSGKKILLVLDGTEKADDFPKIQAISGSSGVIVTSQTHEDAVADWEDIRPLPTNESVNLLQAWCQPLTVEKATVQQICELVGNLPLAVRLAGRYLSHRRVAVSSYLDWLSASPLQALDQGKHRDQSVPILLERSLEQVSEAAKTALALVGRLALSPFSSAVISKSLLIPVYKAEDQLGELVSWGLLDAGDNRYQVTHALIHTYAHDRLILNDETLQRLIEYYLAFTRTESSKGVAGYHHLDLERHHLLSLVTRCIEQGLWQSAIALVQALYEYLYRQGYITEWIVVLEKGITAAHQLQDRKEEISLTNHLGNAYIAVGKLGEAIAYYEQTLAISRETEDRQGEGCALGSLGIAYNDFGQIEKAIGYYKRALTISREIEDRRGEGTRLGNLGRAYRDLGRLEKAIEYFEQALTITREIEDQQGESSVLGNLGIAYLDLGQFEKAIECSEKALVIDREIGLRRGEGSALNNLGIAYRNLGQYEEAIDYSQQALAISREIEDRQGESSALGSLGTAYHVLMQFEEAIDSYGQALTISREIGDSLGEVNNSGNLGLLYTSIKQEEKAIHCLDHSLTISREIRHRQGELSALGGLGAAYRNLGQYEEAINYYEKALAISREIGERHGEGTNLGNLGITYSDLGQKEKAIDYYKQALAISRMIRDRLGESNHLCNLGIAYSDLGQKEKAKQYLQNGLLISEEIGSPTAKQARQWLDYLK